MRVLASVATATAACVLVPCSTTGPLHARQAPALDSRPTRASRPRTVSADFARQPPTFERNDGQTDARVKFLSRGPGYTLFLTDTEAVFSLRTGSHVESSVRMALVGASTGGQMHAFDPAPGHSNYLIGRDSTQWRTNVPRFRRVVRKGAYPGIDVAYYGNPQELEFDFIVEPKANPSAIRFELRGTGTPRIAPNGDLVVPTHAGEIRQRAPVAYQLVGRVRRSVRAAYTLNDEGTVSFTVDPYDVRRPLIIDPVLVYSTYLGGNIQFDAALALNEDGEAHVAGMTASLDFPTTPGVLQESNNGGSQSCPNCDGFVTKFDASGAILFSTYVGGHGLDQVRGMTVDRSGVVHITGHTTSVDFPTTQGAFQPVCPNVTVGCSAGFVAALNETGSALVYSTYLGTTSSSAAVGSAIAVEESGNVVVAGGTLFGFPVTPGAVQPTHSGAFDVFVAKLNSTGSSLIYATYLGGSLDETLGDLAVDASGAAYVGGTTRSSDFPTTPGAFQTTCPIVEIILDCSIGFVTKVSSDGTAFEYSTYLGGRGPSIAALDGVSSRVEGLAVDASGHAFVTGWTLTTDFPTTSGSVKPATTTRDAFVTKFSRDGTRLLYSTYLGGDVGEAGRDDGAFEEGEDIAVDAAGNAFVIGRTAALDFPQVDPIQPGNAGGIRDMYVAAIDASGSTLLFSTYLGGTEQEELGAKIAVHRAGSVHVAGPTRSIDFPTVNAIQPEHGGGLLSAYVAKISAPACPPDVTDRLHIAHLGFWPIGLTPFRLQLVFLRNDSTEPIAGPLAFAMDDLQNGIFLGTRATACSPTGPSPYHLFETHDGVLAPGETIAEFLPFFKTSVDPITYTPRVLGGMPPR